jgi:hypothetical protein
MPIDVFGRTSSTSNPTQKVPTLYLDTKHFLRHDGTVPATSTLDMAGNTIKNLPLPVESTDAANREYVNTKISNLDAELREYIEEYVTRKVTEIFQNSIFRDVLHNYFNP